jgi:hypothetical protein
MENETIASLTQEIIELQDELAWGERQHLPEKCLQRIRDKLLSQQARLAEYQAQLEIES